MLYGMNKEDDHLPQINLALLFGEVSNLPLEDEKEHNSRLSALQEEIESGKRSVDHEKLYTKYFDIKTTPVRETKVT